MDSTQPRTTSQECTVTCVRAIRSSESNSALPALARILAFTRALLPRTRLIALSLFIGLLTGITLQEVMPQYHVEPLRKRGGKWLDHPSFLVGDCPYYRATLRSLLKDHDLDLKNNIERKQ